jgi:hypothetical protein
MAPAAETHLRIVDTFYKTSVLRSTSCEEVFRTTVLVSSVFLIALSIRLRVAYGLLLRTAEHVGMDRGLEPEGPGELDEPEKESREIRPKQFLERSRNGRLSLVV